MFKHRFGSLSFEGVSVRHPVICVHADDNERSFSRKHMDKTQINPVTRLNLDNQDVIVGMNILKSLHVYVSYGEHMLYITADDAH
jgi:hypothetical protein